MPWLPSFTFVQIVLAVIVSLMALGTIGAIVWLIAKGLIAIVMAVPFMLSWGWHWLTNTAANTWGSARWSREKDLARAGLFGQPGMRLGSYRGRELTLRDGHCAIIGPTMSGTKPLRNEDNWGGKTSGHAVPTMRQWKGPAVVLDIRGDIFKATASYRAALGRVLRWCPTDENSIGINLCDAIRWDTNMESADCARLAHAHVSPSSFEVWDHWRREAEPLLGGLLPYARELGTPSLGGVYQFMTRKGDMEDKLKDMLQSPHPSVQAAAQRMLDKADRERSGVWSSLLSYLNFYIDRSIRRVTDASDLDIMALRGGESATSLYLEIHPGDLGRCSAWVRALVSMLVARWTEPSEAPAHPTLLMMDEFPSLGPCDQFETSLPYLGGYNVFCMLIVQGINQLHQNYGPLTSILSNCKAKVFHRPGDGLSAQTIETLLGTTTVTRQSPSEHWQGWGLQRSYGRSEVQTPRALLTTGEILALPDRHEILFVAGLPGPTYADKAPWFRDIAQPAHLMLGRVALVAGALLLLIGGSIGAVALWPTSTTTASKPVPKLAMTTETPVVATLTPETPPEYSGVGWMDRLTIREREPWSLYQEITSPWSKVPVITKDLWGGGFATAAACEEARSQKLANINTMIARQPPGRVHMRRLDNGYEQTLGSRVRRETWRCLQEEDQPS